MANSAQYAHYLHNAAEIYLGGYEPNRRGQEMQTSLLQNFERTKNTITNIFKKWDPSLNTNMQHKTNTEGLLLTGPSSPNKIDASEPKWIKNVKSLYNKQMTHLISNHLSENIFLEETNFNEMHAKSVVRTNQQIQKYFDKCANPPPDEIKGKDGKPDTETFLVSSAEILPNLMKGVESEHKKRRSTLNECREKCKKELSMSILQKWVIQFIEGRVTGTDFLTRFIATKVNAPSSKLGVLLINEIKRDPDIKIYSDSFQHIEKCLDSFRQDVNKKFESNRSFGPTKFMEMIARAKQSAMTFFNCDFAPAQEMLNYGIEHYKLQYTKQNEIINQHEIILGEKLLPQIQAFYCKIMKDFTNEKIFIGNQLEQLHDMVVENSVKMFWNSCGFQPNQEMQAMQGLQTKIQEFQHELQKELRTYSNRNNLKLLKINSQISALQTEQRINYNDRMTQFLPKRGQVQDFHKKHISSKTEAIKLLTIEMSKLQLKVSPEEYAKTLENDIDKDWAEIKKEYERRREKEEDYIPKQKFPEEQQIRDFYRNEMMKCCTNEKIFTTNQLQQLHDSVVENAIKASCGFQPNQEMQTSGLKSKIQEFQDILTSDFQTYVNSNNLKLMKINGQISAFQTEQRKNYCDKMIQFLPKRGQVLNSVQDLDKKHISSKTEAIKLLTIEMSKLQLTVSHEEYAKTLGSNIDKDWVEIQKEYERLKQKEEEHIRTQKIAEEQQRREFEKEEKKREAAKKVKAQEEEFNKLNKKPQEPTNKIRPQKSSSDTSFKIPEAVVTSEIQGLAIEFGFSKVRVGRMVKNKVEFMPNPWGEEWTPTFLSVSSENEIQIGKETIQNQNKILIAEAITNPGSQIFKLLLHGKYQLVKTEVVIALFLSRIRTDIEKNLEGRWTRTVITVPLCLTSMQRQGMKNAASLAGFEQVRLINDTSAAALYFQETRGYRMDMCLLVGVVHDFDCYFDAALYRWRRTQGSNFDMEMISSCGNLHSTGSEPLSFKSLKDGLTNVRALSGNQADQLKSIFRDMVGTNKDKITTNICIRYGTGTEVENLVKHYGRTTVNANIYVLGGAAILAARLSKYSGNAPFSPHFIKERATYTFEKNSLFQHKINMPKIFEGYASIVGPKIFDHHTIGPLSDGQQQIVIWETSQNLTYPVATLVVEGTDCSTFKPRRPELQVKFSLSNEGIFNVDKVYYQNHDQEHELQYQWKTPLIPESDLAKSKSFVEFMAKDEKRELLREKTKNELSMITDKIKEGMHKVEGKMIAEKLLSDEISDATTMLSHPKTTQEMVENKIIILSRLHDKYLSA